VVEQVEQVGGLPDRVGALGDHDSGRAAGQRVGCGGGECGDVGEGEGRAGAAAEVHHLDRDPCRGEPRHGVDELPGGQGGAHRVAGAAGHGDGAVEAEHHHSWAGVVGVGDTGFLPGRTAMVVVSGVCYGREPTTRHARSTQSRDSRRWGGSVVISGTGPPGVPVRHDRRLNPTMR
jgi:hypothetical protein